MQLHEQSQLQTEELELRVPEKAPIPVSITVTAIRNSQQQLVGARWLIRDIRARKQAEAAFRKSEERLRMAVKAARMVTWSWDATRDRSFTLKPLARSWG
ncbi:MAG: hypothetical protein HC832_02745 [Leptolyngbyaceae cyanobacterium RM1_405_57]|nr:hypothetical protein [Leptolyngbyaceae cyanobacterium RM1_405_57]